MSNKETLRLRVLRMACDRQRWEELRRLHFTLGDVMSGTLHMMSISRLLQEALEILSKNRIRHVLITDNKNLAGIISDRDVLRALHKGRHILSRPVREVATPNPKVAYLETSVDQAVSTMLEARISCLPVVNTEGVPLGIVTSTDFLWLFKLVQGANNSSVNQLIRGLVREIDLCVAQSHLSHVEADELTSNLFATAASGEAEDKKPPT